MKETKKCFWTIYHPTFWEKGTGPQFLRKGDPIEPEVDPSGKCELKCVMPEEKAKACDSPTMPWDYSIPKGHHCYAWADDVTTTKCK